MHCCRRANTRPASSPSADGTEPGAEASLERFRCRKARDGPAMRPTASHAAVSSVGKHTARESEAPNAVRMEKSAWRAPTSDFGPGSARNPGHYFPGKTLSARWAQTLCPEPALARAWRADRFPAGHKPQHARSSGLEKKLAWIVTGVVDPGTGLTEANDRGTKFPRSRFSDGSNPPRPIGQLFPR